MDNSKRYSRGDASDSSLACSCNKGRSSCRESCNCSSCAGNKGNAPCSELLKKIRAVDFSLQETVLYLDAYPNCCEALAYYHKLVEIRTSLLDEYNGKCAPLTNCTNVSNTEWNWIRSPWPWEADANK